MSIDFAVKKNVADFVDEAVNKAAVNQGLTQAPVSQPYTKYSILNKIIEPILQARAATERWDLSEKHSNAAHLLNQGYHQTLIRTENPIAEVSSKICKLAGRIKDIDKMRKIEANNYSNCWIFGVVGVAALSIGLYTSASWLKTAGQIVLLLAAAFYGYTWFSHRSDQQKISEFYEQAGKLGEQIRYDLRYYNDDMQAQVKAVEEYQPLCEKFADANYKPAELENLQEVTYSKDSYKTPDKE